MDEKILSLLDDLQSSCTGCGLCNEGCATFQATGWEQESPRGRLHLAGQFLHGRIPPSSSALTTFDRCLGCRACEPLCPIGVSYSKVRDIVQDLRAQLPSANCQTVMKSTQYRSWITSAYRVGRLWWRQYGGKWLSRLGGISPGKGSLVKKYKKPMQLQPVLAFCCIQDFYQHEVIAQTLAFMERLGSPLGIDKQQPCCGAIFERLVHGGEEAVAYPRVQQRAINCQEKTLKSFLRWLSSETFFLSKGCECFISKHLPFAFNAQASLDLYVYIESILKQRGQRLYFSQPLEVYYQPYCSQTGQREEDPIWRLLRGIEGLKFRYVSHPQACCGGYCGETFLHPERVQTLASQKLSDLPRGATVLVTSPDCWGLFNTHQLQLNLNLLYPIQLLAQAEIQTS